MRKILVLVMLLVAIAASSQVKETIIRVPLLSTQFLEKYYPKQLIRYDTIIYELQHPTLVGQTFKMVLDSGWYRVIGIRGGVSESLWKRASDTLTPINNDTVSLIKPLRVWDEIEMRNTDNYPVMMESKRFWKDISYPQDVHQIYSSPSIGSLGIRNTVFGDAMYGHFADLAFNEGQLITFTFNENSVGMTPYNIYYDLNYLGLFPSSPTDLGKSSIRWKRAYIDTIDANKLYLKTPLNSPSDKILYYDTINKKVNYGKSYNMWSYDGSNGIINNNSSFVRIDHNLIVDDTIRLADQNESRIYAKGKLGVGISNQLYVTGITSLDRGLFLRGCQDNSYNDSIPTIYNGQVSPKSTKVVIQSQTFDYLKVSKSDTTGIGTPSNRGLIIYQTSDNKHYMYNGTWHSLY